MLNVGRIACACLTCVAASLVAAGQPGEVGASASASGVPESILRSNLCDATVSWLNTRSQAEASTCDKLAETLLAHDKITARSYFVTAQSAWWRGQREPAVARLSKVVERYGDEDALYVRVPARVVGRLWMATMARYSGSPEQAKSMYEKSLEALAAGPNTRYPGRKADAMILCHLYLAELEAGPLGSRDKAVAHLRAAEAVKVDPNAVTALDKVFVNWARYERVKTTDGKTQANQQLPRDDSLMAMLAAMSMHLTLVGLTGSPLIDGLGPGAKVDAFEDVIRKQVLESDVSAIDKMLMRFLAGSYYELKGDPSEAAKRYMEVFEEDSFVSASAGLLAASAMDRQGKTREARRILERVSARYPQFGP